jgi:hypothetical protein
MTKIDAYLGHARDCNIMALSAASDEHRKLLHEMANTWKTLAREHARMTGQPPPEAAVRANAAALPAAPPKKSKLQSEPSFPVTTPAAHNRPAKV